MDRSLFNPLQRNGLRSQLVSQILTGIFERKLLAGHSLNAQRLAQQFGVSATPVREALVELATIGVVEMRHNRGTVVRPFGAVQLDEIYHVRSILEAEATLGACRRLPAEPLLELEREMTMLMDNSRQPAWSDQAMAADCKLHTLIATACGNRRLAEEISRYNELVQCIREIVGNQDLAQQQALPEHLAILAALRHRKPEAAAQAMRHHIERTAQSAKAAVFPSEVGERVAAE